VTGSSGAEASPHDVAVVAAVVEGVEDNDVIRALDGGLELLAGVALLLLASRSWYSEGSKLFG